MTFAVLLRLIILVGLVTLSAAKRLCNATDGALSIEGNGDNVLGQYRDMNNTMIVFLDRSEDVVKLFCMKHDGNFSNAIVNDTVSSELTNHTNVMTFDIEKLKNSGTSGSNTQPMMIHCEKVCIAHVIVVKEAFKGCNVSDTLQCDLGRDKQLAKKAFVLGPDGPFVPTITYSIFDPVVGSWVKCDEFDDDGESIEVSTDSGEHNTDSINCPIDRTSREDRPVIIRVEEHKPKTKECVALPVSCVVKEPEYSFFSHQIKASEVDRQEAEPQVENLVWIYICITISIILFLVILTGLFAFVRYRQRCKINSTQFYIETHEIKSNSDNNDNLSMKTETTTSQYHPGPLFISDEDVLGPYLKFSDDSEEGVKRRKQILNRQLSGDPSKLNPDLSVNEQAKVLPYNPRYEIDRSHFEVGKMLGSGMFGSVYEGSVNGLFHPGSKTKVAIKTVNNNLDPAQITALMCEMKVLAHLDLHLNLVNLLGSCTSQIEHGELWLLIEFCPQGDMKSFLIKHREEFMSSIRNNITINGLDERLFFKWAHSIAKGMDYLSSKKIMHGDLAARNILIGGVEGDDNLVAKVSDFGLSKTFYDNIRYKKENRAYVPWKWMALEYLQDGCFTMKSDVWSFGVVLWEILSLGQEPYMGKDVQTAIGEIKGGLRLPCPDILGDLDWLQEFYQKATYGCWQADPSTRYSFSDLVGILEAYLTPEESKEHQDLNERYVTMRDLINDDMTRSKRASAKPQSPTANITSVASYHKVFAMEESGNVTPAPVPDSNGYLRYEVGKNGQIETVVPEETKESPPPGYITMSEAMA